ncbi:MAG: radical SAM protein, partial [Candidatus Roizmanbacteria bacterium]
CGLCPDHEQHTCIGLIEVTNECGLKCPVCYANAGNGPPLRLESIEKMMDFYQAAEHSKAELLQISGGEPTAHPQIIEILQMAKKKKFKYVMLNTNGIRLASDTVFVKELSLLCPGFEVYLQFDGLLPKTHEYLRGKDLTDVKKRAITNLSEYNIPITLVTTVENDINDQELGSIFTYALNTKCIRGINFQPVAYFGRTKDTKINNRSTLTGILQKLEKQTNGMLQKNDFLPLPCHPERVAFTYLYKNGGSFVPITRGMNAEQYVPLIKNTFTFTPEDIMQKLLQCNDNNCMSLIKDLLPLVPLSYFAKSVKQKQDYINENIFRISITSFVDIYNFDMKSMKKECVHIITPDLKRIPFSAYNMFHRKKYQIQNI